MMELLWIGIGVLTWTVIVIVAQINPVLAEYNSDGRDLMYACRHLEGYCHPLALAFMSTVMGPIAPLALLIVAVWKHYRRQYC